MSTQEDEEAADEDYEKEVGDASGDGQDEMSRLVGRDGYLLPFATSEFHMNKEAELHRLHHQDTGIDHDAKVAGVRDNENVFFRYRCCSANIVWHAPHARCGGVCECECARWTITERIDTFT